MVAQGADKFNFVSPGVQVAEIDNSRRPRVSAGDGPVVVGRAFRGPGLRPVSVNSRSQLREIYGNPHAGGLGGDVWRDGNRLAPLYGMYAADAWLKKQTQLTFVRLLGSAHTDAATGGEAGWTIGSAHDASLTSGGAFGLFVIDSGTAGSVANTGTLAAVFYANAGSIELSGTNRDGTSVTGTAVLIASQGTDKEFKALVKNSAGTITDTVSFNFNVNSRKYVRSVFNTNPTLLNTNITNTAQQKTYFLGETFDRCLADTVSGTASGGQFAMILSLASGTTEWNVQQNSARSARSGWFISQNLGASGTFQADQQTQLFRLVSHDSGEWEQKNLKISIADIRAPVSVTDDPYGTFTVLIRQAQDSDNAPRVLERFTGCNLNPNSPNYVAAKIGDMSQEWDDTERRFREFGNHVNMSKYFRVEMNSDVDAGATNPELLPFGVLGPVRFKGFAVFSGSSTPHDFGTDVQGGGSAFASAFGEGNANVVNSKGNASIFVDTGAGANSAFSGSFLYPSIPLRSTSRVGNIASPTDAYFGVDSTRASSQKFDKSYWDKVRLLPGAIDDASLVSTEYSYVFTLDDLVRLGTVDAQWTSGSHAGGTALNAVSGVYTAILDAGFDRFTADVHGGFDGLDITEKEPFNNRVLSGQSQVTSYEFNSVKRAIDSVADPEVVDANLLAVPGVTNTSITDHMLRIAENRADMLAIIDVEGGFLPNSENANGDSSAANRGDVDTTISNLKARAINTSYGTAYYPWVQIRDEESGAKVWIPPSIVALGVYGNTSAEFDDWIAPAGFTRGGLTEGHSGLQVIGVRERLDKKQRDRLYAVNINPIGKFPNEGIVIFGQKTLQVTPSALDRVNVRRLMIAVKKGISRIASRLLFDQNLETTWKRFKGQTNAFLESVKARFGLSDFRVVLDRTTTTPDLIDRNIMYAQIFLKPAKAIEFIGLDFNITPEGGSFDD